MTARLTGSMRLHSLNHTRAPEHASPAYTQDRLSAYQKVEVGALRNSTDTLWFEPVEIKLMAEVQ